MVSYLDEQVGDLVSELKKLGIYENTIIIFSSDNGPTYNGGTDSPWFDSGGPFKSEYGWGKGFVHEGGIRVPMIVSWPEKMKQGRDSDYISSFYDIMPTLCEIAGVEVPSDADGVSLLPVFTGSKEVPEADPYYCEFPSYGGQQAIRMGKWKAIRRKIFEGNLEIELYDLEKDIREQNDIATSIPKL